MNAITDEVLLKNGFLYKNPDNSHLSSLYKCGERNEWRIMIEKGYDSKNQFGYTNSSGTYVPMKTTNHTISYFTGGVSAENAESAATKYPELNIQLENIYNYQK